MTDEPKTYVLLKAAAEHLGCSQSELGRPIRRKPWRHGKMRQAFIPYSKYVEACSARGITPAALTRLYWEDGRSYAVTD